MSSFKLNFSKILSKRDSSLRCSIKVFTVDSREKSPTFVNQNLACLAMKQGLLLYNIVPLEGASLVSQTVKNLPAMQGTRVGSLDWEDPLEKEMATHSCLEYSCLEKSIDREYNPWGCKELDMTEQL